MEPGNQQPETAPRILDPLCDFARWLAYLFVVTVVGALGVLYWVHTRFDDEMRVYFENKLQRHYPELQVSVRSAHRLAGQGVQIRGILISEVDGNKPIPIAQIDELLVHCDTGLTELLSEDHQPERIELRGVRMRARRGSDGNWNLAQLFPIPGLGDRPVPAMIHSSTVEIVTDNATSVLQLRDIQVSLLPPDADGSNWRWQGFLRGDGFDTIRVAGEVHPVSRSWRIWGNADGLDTHQSAVSRLPSDVRGMLQPVKALQGSITTEFHVAGQKWQVNQYALRGEFHGTVEESRLPRPIRDVSIRFRGTQDWLQLEHANGQFDETRLVGSGLFHWNQGQRTQFQLKATQLVLDRALYSKLPVPWKEVWDKFDPEGVIDLSLQMSFDGKTWRRRATVNALGVAFSYYLFPYRLNAGQGVIEWDDRGLEIKSLHASASGRPVQIRGKLHDPGPDATGWVEFSVEQPIALDERLISAIPGQPQAVIRKLQPHGSVALWGRYWRDLRTQPVSKRLEVTLQDCAINYQGFQYPIYQINGKIHVSDDRWEFSSIRGVNDSAYIVCDGQWSPQAGLQLDLDAMDVPLEDELRDALSSPAQQLWYQLRPRGTVDQLQIHAAFAPVDRQLKLSVTAHKQAPRLNVEGRSISIEPEWLPYELDNLTGTVHYQDGSVLLNNLRAHHGETDVRVSGTVDKLPGDDWRIRLNKLTADRIFATHRLTSSLPASVGAAIAKMNLTGPVALNGWLELAGRAGEVSPSLMKWQVELDIEDGSINCGANLQHIHGGLTLRGVKDDDGVRASGELFIDSTIFKGIQLTQIRGPLSLTGDELTFGMWANGQSTPRPVVGHAVGGLVLGSGKVWLDESQFELHLDLQGGDLAAISREATRHKLDISGRTMASIDLRGSQHGVHTLRGEGTVELQDADIYELPVMIRLLKLLSIRPPNETAFTSSDAAFRIEGDRIYFDRIDFAGDAISLEGRGEMTLQRVLNITFDTSVGRDDNQPLSLLLRPLLKEAGRRLMVLRVTGTLDVPEIERIALPDVNEGIQQVFPEQQARRPGN